MVYDEETDIEIEKVFRGEATTKSKKRKTDKKLPIIAIVIGGIFVIILIIIGPVLFDFINFVLFTPFPNASVSGTQLVDSWGSECSSFELQSIEEGSVVVVNDGCDDLDYFYLMVDSELFRVNMDRSLRPTRTITVSFFGDAGKVSACGNNECEENSGETFSNCRIDCPYCNVVNSSRLSLFDYDTGQCNPASDLVLIPVFLEDFELNYTYWASVLGDGYWELNNGVLESDFSLRTDEVFPTLYFEIEDTTDDDFYFNSRMKVSSGELFVILKDENLKGGYVIRLGEEYIELIKEFDESVNSKLLLREDTDAISYTDWFVFELLFIEGRLVLFIDDTLVLDFMDSYPNIISGDMGVTVNLDYDEDSGGYQSGSSFIDDVLISEVH